MSVVLSEDRIHPLLRNPEVVNLDLRHRIAAAYEEKVRTLAGSFITSADVLRPAIPVTVYYYSDNNGPLSDTAPKEIDRFLHDSGNAIQVLTGIEKPVIVHRDTLAQSWATGSFDLAQTTRYSMGTGVGNITFLNCAPRIDERGQNGNTTNKGEPIYVGILPNGHVISANSRYNFVHFRDAVENGALEIFEANVQADGTQFRSRDIFPLHTMVLANLLTRHMKDWQPDMDLAQRRELLNKLGYIDTSKKLDIEHIRQLEQFTVANIDVHGNIKTNTRISDLDQEFLQSLRNSSFTIEIDGEDLPRARFTAKMFERKVNEAGISEGSSGHSWQGAAHDDGFLEVSIIGGSAAAKLKLGVEKLKSPIKIQIIPDDTLYPIENRVHPVVNKPRNNGKMPQAAA